MVEMGYVFTIQFLLRLLKLLMELWVVVKSQDLASECERWNDISPSTEATVWLYDGLIHNHRLQLGFVLQPVEKVLKQCPSLPSEYLQLVALLSDVSSCDRRTLAEEF